MATSAARKIDHNTDHEIVKVTPDNFCRAETDMYFGNFVRDAGGIARVFHHRNPTPVNEQSVIRMNRDTLYSSAVFDLDAGPVTVHMPDAGKRFMSLQVIDEDHYIVGEVSYGAATRTLTKENVGTRYVALFVRTLVDANDAADIKNANLLQDAIKVEQKGAGRWESPQWDPVTQKKAREALVLLGETLPDSRHACGTKKEVDVVRHLICTAGGWGGNREKDAYYTMGVVPQNDGHTAYALTVKDVPVNGFWSVTVYNKEGYLEPNPQNAYAFNNLTAKKNPDGAVTIHFGGDAKALNVLPIVKGWTYAVRLYRPRPEILSGKWTFPEAMPVTG